MWRRHHPTSSANKTDELSPAPYNAVAHRWERARRVADVGPSPPEEADAIDRSISTVPTTGGCRRPTAATTSSIRHRRADHDRTRTQRQPQRKQYPVDCDTKPAPRLDGSLAARIASYRAWITANPDRHSPALDYGVGWRPDRLNHSWRVLWNTMTREMFAISTRCGEIYVIGTCVDQAHADAVARCLPTLNHVADHLAETVRRHRLSCLDLPMPEPHGVSFTLASSGPGSTNTSTHARQPEDVDAAVRRHLAANTPDTQQRRLQEQITRYYREKSAWYREYRAVHPDEFGDPPLPWARQVALDWPGPAMQAYGRLGRIDDPAGLMSEVLARLNQVDANPDLYTSEHDDLAELARVAAAAATPHQRTVMGNQLVAHGIILDDRPTALRPTPATPSIEPRARSSPTSPTQRSPRRSAARNSQPPMRPPAQTRSCEPWR